jgi:retron-type reverse transcriptase
MKRYNRLFEKICDIENLFDAYRVCLRGKRLRRGVLPFTYNLSKELFQIRRELKNETYRTGAYYSFYVHEPKKRLVQSLPFRDRIVQQALCQVINIIFEQTFIKDTYACIKGRGTHAGSDQLVNYMRKAQAKFGKAYCLQCDIASYFPSIDHSILINMFEQKIKCRKTMDLIRLITDSNGQAVGIPIGNLLSQLSANIYLNALDHHAKEHWRLPYYIRYMDDFCILHGSKKYLWWLKGEIQTFLRHRLALTLNRKSSLFPISQGVDFLGYRTWTTHKLVRKRSINKARRKFKGLSRLYHAGKISMDKISESARSWSAHCEHADTYRLRSKMFNMLRKDLERK